MAHYEKSDLHSLYSVVSYCIMLYSSHYSLHGNVANIREVAVEIAFIGVVNLLILMVIIFLNK